MATDLASPAPESSPPPAQAVSPVTTPPSAPTTQPGPEDSPDFWVKEFAAFKKWATKFHTTGRFTEDKFLAEQTEIDGLQPLDSSLGGYQLFWSNVMVLQSLLFSRMPEVGVERTHLDPADDAARVASLILERIFSLEANTLASPYLVFKAAIRDRLVPGFGVAWARYEFKEQSQTVPAITHPETGQEMAPQVNLTVITEEMAPLDYVRWEEFCFSPAPTWGKVWWIARRVPMTKAEVAARFGQDISEEIGYALKKKGTSNEDPYKAAVEPLAEVWEIWCKRNRRVYWYCKGFERFLDLKDDPLRLFNFFPVPMPLHATVTTKAFLPRADYVYVQDQYAELDLINNRCKLLTEALRVVGVYDKTSTALQRILQQAAQNDMIAVDNWAMFAEKGGIKGAVDWFPVDMVAGCLKELTLRKQALVQEIYEILGISDIMRGSSSPYETAMAQKIKANFGSARSDTLSGDVAEFITQCTRLRAEVICKHWQPNTIIERSQIMSTPDGQNQQLIMQAMQLLKGGDSVKLVTRINISADSFTSPDWGQEKQQRVDFLQAISQFVGMVTPLVQQYPDISPFVVQIIQWVATGFKAGKQMEGVLDQLLQALQKDLQTPKPPPPPTAAEVKDYASASKSFNEAKVKAVEAYLDMAALGIPPEGWPMLPPPGMPPTPPGQQVSPQPGMMPPGMGGPPGQNTPPPPGMMPPPPPPSPQNPGVGFPPAPIGKPGRPI